MDTVENEITMHVEDGVHMYSVVKTHQSSFCAACFQDVPETREIQILEFDEADMGRFERYRVATLEICVGCVARILNLKRGEELYCGHVEQEASVVGFDDKLRDTE